MLHIIDNREDLTGALVCRVLFQGHKCEAFDSSEEWTVKIPWRPSKIEAKQYIPSGSYPLTIVQISDLHYDTKYQDNTPADCQHLICCRRQTQVRYCNATDRQIVFIQWYILRYTICVFSHTTIMASRLAGLGNFRAGPNRFQYFLNYHRTHDSIDISNSKERTIVFNQIIFRPGRKKNRGSGRAYYGIMSINDQ